MIPGILTLALAVTASQTATNFVVATSGSYADVSSAVARAQVVNVPTVQIPSGTNTWINSVQFVDVGVSLVCTGSTPCSINFAGSEQFGMYLQANGLHLVVSNFVFDVNQATGPGNAIIALDGSNNCFRFSHLTFLNPSSGQYGYNVFRGLVFASVNTNLSNGPWGLIDHCNFYWSGGLAYNYISSMNNGATAQFEWTQPMTWGTTNTIMVENCTFTQTTAGVPNAAFEAQGGANLCVRYCNFTNVEESTHGFASGSACSTRQIEFYMNNMYYNDNASEIVYAYLQRGGTAVIWSNTVAMIDGFNLSDVCQFWVECAQTDWQGVGGCARQLTYPSDYPAYEQIGQGVSSGSITNVASYMWGNSFPNTQYGPISLGANLDSAFIVQGRDIYTNSVMSGYTALAYPSPQDN